MLIEASNSGAAAAGIGFLILTILFWLAMVALSFWIFYLIIRTAVKNGIIRAAQAGAVMVSSRPTAASRETR